MVSVKFAAVAVLSATAMAMSSAIPTTQTNKSDTSASSTTPEQISSNTTILGAHDNEPWLPTPIEVVEKRAASPNDEDDGHKGKAHPKIHSEPHPNTKHHDGGKHGRYGKHESKRKQWRGHKRFHEKKLSPWLDPSFGTLEARIAASIAAGPAEDRFKMALKRVREIYRHSFPSYRRGTKCKLIYNPMCLGLVGIKHTKWSRAKMRREHPECKCV